MRTWLEEDKTTRPLNDGKTITHLRLAILRTTEREPPVLLTGTLSHILQFSKLSNDRIWYISEVNIPSGFQHGGYTSTYLSVLNF